MSNLKVNTINDASGGSNAVLYGVAAPANSMGFRNRIINGDMRIDQRNAGASATIGPSTSQDYRVDRFFLQRFGGTATYTGQQSTTAPAGFVNSLSATVAIAATPTTNNSSFIRQLIEGFNVADLGFGTANAQAVTLSFWVRSSITGTHGGSVTNGGFTRSYVFTYSIASANTWEYKTITVPGDTSGTWATDNSAGMRVNFDLGCGPDLNGTAGTWASASVMRTSGCVTWIANSGATFYITGVQLEAGSVATPFERRDYGRELMMCQRYFCKTFEPTVAPVQNAGTAGAIGFISQAAQPWDAMWKFPADMRTQPTLATYSTNAASSNWSTNTYTPTASVATAGVGSVTIRASGIGAAGYGFTIHVTATAEL
jgi:hypothetical protein